MSLLLWCDGTVSPVLGGADVVTDEMNFVDLSSGDKGEDVSYRSKFLIYGGAMKFPSATGLRVFDAAARLGSFRVAADELGVSPTAVSHQIRSLEGQLGFALFVRKVRKVELTAAGARLASVTATAFQQISDTLEELTEVERRLTASTTPAFAALWLVPRLPAFEEAYPDIQVHVDTTTTVIDLGRDRRIDLAIRYGDGDYHEFVATRILTESIGAFGAPDYVSQLSDFSQASLIHTHWTSKDLRGMTWTKWAKAAGEPRGSKPRTFDQEQQVIQAGLSGQGLILISNVLVEDMVTRGWLVPYRPDVQLAGLNYTAVVAPSQSEIGKVRRFLAWLQQQAGA